MPRPPVPLSSGLGIFFQADGRRARCSLPASPLPVSVLARQLPSLVLGRMSPHGCPNKTTCVHVGGSARELSSSTNLEPPLR